MNARVKVKNKQTSILSFMFCCLFVSELEATPRFSQNNGVVIDIKTSLLWQDSYPKNSGKIKSGSQVQAKQYCSKLTLSGKSDWRLPTRSELMSLVDKKRKDPAIQSAFKHTAVDEGYLTTTEFENDSETVWIVDFFEGNSVDVALISSDGYRVRCVTKK